jgi:predicted transcriptional regulator of viral defense system
MIPVKVEKLPNSIRRAIDIFKKAGGILHTAEAIKKGIHPAVLYRMRNVGILEVMSRGIYRLFAAPPLNNPDFVVVSIRISSGVICLISALSFHGITIQIPHSVHVALPYGAEEPRIEYPPVSIYRFSGRSFTEGIEIHIIDEVSVRIYSPEKTLADCFKFRHRIGMDTAIEAIRMYRDKGNIKVKEIIHFAEICRVRNVMQPYLEAIF